MALRNKKLVYAVAAGLLLIVALVPMPSLTLKGKGAIRGAMTPAERGTAGLLQRLTDAAAGIRGIGGAAERNRELQNEVMRLQAELNRLADVERENVNFRKAFRFYRQQPLTMIPCDVVSRNISGWWSSVRIGKGASSGIRNNQAVISPDGLVGRTAEVSPFTTEVLLVSDPACRVSAKVKRADVFGLVRGNGSTLRGEPKARMEFINKDVVLRINDEVVTSGLGAFPKGVHIGYISNIDTDDSGLYQFAEIVPSAAAGLLDYVFVVTDLNREAGQ